MKVSMRSATPSQVSDIRLSEAARTNPKQKALQVTPPLLYICRDHPLVRQAITGILEADAAQCFTLESVSAMPAVLDPAVTKLALIDLPCLFPWKGSLSKWIASGVRTIALLPREDIPFSEQMKLLNLGVWGIIVISTHFSRELPRAIESVLAGNLWIGADILQEYVKQTSSVLARLPESRTFTVREEQIINCLIRGLSNRQIGLLLKISERTVKFHVSNILDKAKVENRRELLQVNPPPVYMAGG